MEYLLDVGRGLGSRVVLIPTSDDTVQLVADHADALAERFLFPRVPPSLIRSLSNKRDLYFLAKSHRIPTPETAFPLDRDEAVWFASETGFPVVLKAADGLRLEARTGWKMVIVRTPEELLREYDRREDPENPNLMIQEYIPGGDDTIWMFEGYFGDDSECLAGFTGRKLRQHPVHVGATSLGELVCSPMVDRTTGRFMKALGYRGMLDVGYRFDARDGSYKLLDPNPRIGSTFRLFVGEDDMDVVRLMYLDLTGRAVPAVRPRWGRRWLIEDRDLFSSLEYAREGTLTLRCVGPFAAGRGGAGLVRVG